MKLWLSSGSRAGQFLLYAVSEDKKDLKYIVYVVPESYTDNAPRAWRLVVLPSAGQRTSRGATGVCVVFFVLHLGLVVRKKTRGRNPCSYGIMSEESRALGSNAS